MSLDSPQSKIDRQAAAARRAMAGEPTRSRGAQSSRFVEDEALLDSYLQRLEPAVAASFTAPQREAIKTMLGWRHRRKHRVDLRPNFALGRHRYYLVFLFGRDQRIPLRRTPLTLQEQVKQILTGTAIALTVLFGVFLILL